MNWNFIQNFVRISSLTCTLVKKRALTITISGKPIEMYFNALTKSGTGVFFSWHTKHKFPKMTLYDRHKKGKDEDNQKKSKDWKNEIKADSWKEILDFCEQNILKIYSMAFYIEEELNDKMEKMKLNDQMVFNFSSIKKYTWKPEENLHIVSVL